MKKVLLITLLAVLFFVPARSQCNDSLNLGSVVFPLNSDLADPLAWFEAARWSDSLGLDFRESYFNWNDMELT